MGPPFLCWCLADLCDARQLVMNVRKRIRLHLTTGRTIDGVLIHVSRRDQAYELADVRVEIDGQLQPVDGRVFVPKNRVEFAQAGGAA